MRKVIRPYRPADRCFKHATGSIVALDTAWPWANDTYGLCCLHAYLCVHKHICTRSYAVIPQIGIAMGFLLQIRMSWLRFRKGVGAGAGVVVLGAGAVSWLSARLRRGGAISWLCRLRAFLLQPVACQQVVEFCVAIWVYAGVTFFTYTHTYIHTDRRTDGRTDRPTDGRTDRHTYIYIYI